jgi:hypothetical protein
MSRPSNVDMGCCLILRVLPRFLQSSAAARFGMEGNERRNLEEDRFVEA